MRAFGNCFAGLTRPGINARATQQRRVNPALARFIGRCSVVRRLHRRTSAGRQANWEFPNALKYELRSWGVV
ncbi:MAG: hypothetical protein HS114_21565 [Anaerolineales bacterium]|nr:hypothetical protein [Anaerolineales bacterium]